MFSTFIFCTVWQMFSSIPFAYSRLSLPLKYISHHRVSLSLVPVLMISLSVSTYFHPFPILLQYSSIYLFLSSQKLARFSSFLWSKTYHSSIQRYFDVGKNYFSNIYHCVFLNVSYIQLEKNTCYYLHHP